MSIGKYTIPMHANGILFDEQSPIAALKCFCCFVNPKFGEDKLAWTFFLKMGWLKPAPSVLETPVLVGGFKYALCSSTSPSKHLSDVDGVRTTLVHPQTSLGSEV